MRNDRIIPGTVLVIIGILFLLASFNVINFNWWSLIDLWPILLIMGGINLIFAHNRSHWATALKIGVLIAGMSILVYGGINNHEENWTSHWGRHFNRSFNDDNNDNDNNSDDSDSSDNDNARDSVRIVDGYNIYRQSFAPGTQKAELNISGGGATYTLKGITNSLFEAATKENGTHYELKSHIDSATQVLDFDMNTHRHGVVFNFGNKDNRADIKLNTNPEWDINLETGAAKLDFDLSYFKVRKLDIQGGAASFDIKMGQPLASTNVTISTGVSAVTVSIPQGAACRITTDTGLSSKSFDGFDKKDDDTYQTPGFDQAKNKMYISMEGGVSDFKVRRY